VKDRFALAIGAAVALGLMPGLALVLWGWSAGVPDESRPPPVPALSVSPAPAAGQVPDVFTTPAPEGE
jgi:hypothetical protein